ncbi:MAG: hypothetical protein JNJ71_03750 [Rubrivivax sp.]|nr:hypothetical protein [Rubrivivax sp.]
MEPTRLAWPEDRRLFRRPRFAWRGFPVSLALVAAAALLVLSVSGWS